MGSGSFNRGAPIIKSVHRNLYRGYRSPGTSKFCRLLLEVENTLIVIVKALCHDIRLDCFVIAALVAKFNLKWVLEVTWYVV